MKTIRVSDIFEKLKGCENYNVTFSFDKILGEQVCVKPHNRTVNINIPEPPTFSATLPTVFDKDVSEIAKMQRELDALYYMLFHLASFARGYSDGYALLASSDDAVNNSVRTLYNFIKEHREDKK